MGKDTFPIHLGNKDSLVVGDTVYKSAYVIDLTEKDLEIARRKHEETDEKKRKCLEELKRRLSKDGTYRTDDDFLLRFLRVRKFDCEKTYQNIKNFCYQRKKYPDLFGTSSTLKSNKYYEIATILPYADEEGRILCWVDLDYWNPPKMAFEEYIQPVIATADIAIANPKCQVNGIITVWDMKNFGIGHVSEYLKKNRLMAIVSLGNFSYPWRISKIIMVNTGRFTRIIYSILRPLLSKKLADRMLLLGSDLTELHQHINPAILPMKLGGALEDDFCRNPNLVLDNLPYLEYDRSFTGEKYSKSEQLS